MATKLKQPKPNQQANAISKKSSRSAPKKSAKRQRHLQRSALCLTVLGLSFSLTSVTLAFVDLGPSQRVIDMIGRTTGDPELQNINQSISTVDDYLQQSQEFYRNITRKNLSGILRQLESILGELGIPNPRQYPQTIEDILNGAGMTDGDATTPGEIYIEQQTITDTANSDQFWIYTDAVLGNGELEGQSRLQSMNRTSVANTETSVVGQQQSAEQSGQAIQSAELASTAATNSQQLSLQAQQRNITQDIMKDVAAQQSELAKSNAAVANQLATLSRQSAIAAAQTSLLASQSQINNEHLTELRIGQTIGNVQLHDIFNAQRHANQMTVMESQKNAQLSIGSTDAIYIPGLFAVPATANTPN